MGPAFERMLPVAALAVAFACGRGPLSPAQKAIQEDNSTPNSATPPSMAIPSGVARPALTTPETARVFVEDLGLNAGGGCALTNTGDLYCWDWASEGAPMDACEKAPQEAEPCPAPSALSPQPCRCPRHVPLSEPVRDFRVGEFQACALLAGGSRVCWGNTHGNPNKLRETVANGVHALVSGYPADCWISTQRELYCEGSNFRGRLGQPESEASLAEPTRVPLDSVVAAYVGYSFGCAVTETGETQCWGDGFGCDGPRNVLKGQTTLVGDGAREVCSLDAMGRATAITVSRPPTLSSECHGGSLDDGHAVVAPVQVPGRVTTCGLRGQIHLRCATSAVGALCWSDKPAQSWLLPTAQQALANDEYQFWPGRLNRSAKKVVTDLVTVCALSTSGHLECIAENSWGALGRGSDPKHPQLPETPHLPWVKTR